MPAPAPAPPPAPASLAGAAALGPDGPPDGPRRARPGTGPGPAPVLVLVLGVAALVVVVLTHLATGRAAVGLGDVVDLLTGRAEGSARDVLVGTRAPRTLAGLVVGAALGVAGALFQAATRNPLAEASTLGVNAGANLAVVAVTVWAVPVQGLPRGGVALLGGLLAAAVVVGVASGEQASPVRMILAGVGVSLGASAVAAALLILHEQDASGLFLWGRGALAQTGYGGVATLGPVVAVALAVAWLAGPRLDVLALGDATASALGVRPRRWRLSAAGVGVVLSAAAVAVVGPIGFVGLAAPHAVRRLGARAHRHLLAGAALWGGVLLLGADLGAQLLRRGASGTEVPAGVVAALAGGPVLLLLARRAVGGDAPPNPAAGRRLGARVPDAVVVAAGVLALVALGVVGLAVGDLPTGVGDVLGALVGRGDQLVRDVVLLDRLPRVVVAGLAGAGLAVAGVVLQGATRNPLADPTLLGVTGGAACGALGLLALAPGAPAGLLPVAAFVGAMVVLAVVLAAAWADGLQAERLVLVGVAAAASTAAAVDALVVHQGLRLSQALVWLAGSTYAQDRADMGTLALWLVVLGPALWLAGRHLDVLGLGDDAARSLGVRLGPTRAAAVVLACTLAASTVAVVGTVGFVGLLAPHLARPLVGPTHRKLLPVAALVGAGLLVAADLAGRTLWAPREVPSGLVVALVGAPFFLWVLRRTRDDG